MDELQWFKEPTTPPQSEEDRLDAQVFERAKHVFVAIYEFAAPDPDKTQEGGRQRYKNVPFIAVREEGTKDYVSRPMTEDDQRRYPRCWRWWLERKEQARNVSCALLPGMTPAPLRELVEMKLGTVDALAAFDGELDNLNEWRVLAKRLVSLAKPRLRLVDGKMEQVA